MTRRAVFGACIAILITAAWNVQLLTQAAPQGQSARPPSKASVGVAATPCVGQEYSAECAIYRLNQIDRRLNDLEASLRSRESGPARSVPSGRPISQLKDPGGKADATSDYIQERIDALAKSVTELINRVNQL